MAAVRAPFGTMRTLIGSDDVRHSVVVPVGVIVAVAIVCVVVAVLGSARRADEVALEHEKRLFTQAIVNRGERIVRELESIAASQAAARKIRLEYDPVWVQRRVGRWLETHFDHDFVFLVDGADRLVYALLGGRSVDPNWFNSIRSDLKPVLEHVRGHPTPDLAGAFHLADSDPAGKPRQTGRAARLQVFLNNPAIIAAAAIAPAEPGTGKTDEAAPVLLSVKFIDKEVLADIAARLQLNDLRKVDTASGGGNDYVFTLADPTARNIAQFTWAPKRPGAQIVQSVIPFILIALAGFALLSGLVARYMRRTAVTIAAGETRLRHLALHDPLCSLPNRIFFGERLDATIEEVRLGGPRVAVLYIDLDHFKDVNDTLGHPVGDELIRNVSRRLTHAMREDDLVARLGGDEFAVISSAGTDEATLLAIGGRIIESICAPYSINGQTIVIGASIGIAVVHEHVGTAADIMRYADMALYRAKNEGRNRACIYDTAMDDDLLKRKLLEHNLRAAIDNDGLRLAYQPIVNSSGETVLGVEALCRWFDPERGEIPPSEFVSIAESSDLIIDLGEWVLRRACLDGQAWPGLSVSVNVSPLQFRRSDFVDMVERILAETGFDPSRLELEVTESTLIGNFESAELAMFRLKALGVRLALDDFGTGYSSLLYLRRFPFDKLKIDRSFVHSIEKAADAAAIVHAVVSLGRGLGMKVTAEGVETAEQHLFLRAAGVHCMQGFRFGRPAPAEAISRRVASPGSFLIADEENGMALAG